MEKEPNQALSDQIVREFETWFETEFIPHQMTLLSKWKKASSHNVNPYLVAFKSAALTDNTSPMGIAESLIVTSWLGQGLSTSFGMQFQSQLTKILRDVFGSTTSGIDVEYVDFFDGRKKYAQIKLGPETINKDDVTTIDEHFSAIKRLARTNSLPLQLNDLVIGVIYGSHEQLNSNYNSLKTKNYQLYVGNEFFEHITGVADLGTQLIEAAVRVSKKVKIDELLREAIEVLAQDPEIVGLLP